MHGASIQLKLRLTVDDEETIILSPSLSAAIGKDGRWHVTSEAEPKYGMGHGDTLDAAVLDWLRGRLAIAPDAVGVQR